MPIYDFECIQCGFKREEMVSSETKLLDCPKCMKRSFKRQLSAPKEFILYGDGFYKESQSE